MIVRLAIRYLYRSLPKGYYLAQITKLLVLHLGSSTQGLNNTPVIEFAKWQLLHWFTGRWNGKKFGGSGSGVRSESQVKVLVREEVLQRARRKCWNQLTPPLLLIGSNFLQSPSEYRTWKPETFENRTFLISGFQIV